MPRRNGLQDAPDRFEAMKIYGVAYRVVDDDFHDRNTAH